MASEGTAGPEPRALYGWLDRHAALVDAAIAFFCVVIIGGLYLVSATGAEGRWTAAMQIALLLPLAWRRTHPFPAACVMAGACLVQVLFRLPLGPGQFAVLVIIGANAARSARWASRSVLAAGLAGIVLLAVRDSLTGEAGAGVTPIVVLIVSGWALVGVAWLLGDLARSRRLEREALAERAVRSERERAMDRELAAAEARRHVARELHDVVAHSLAVVVTQADGARYAAAGTPGPAVPALDAIAATAREALHDMRGLLGVLRDGGDAPLAPSADLADLPAVVAAVRRAGLQVGFTVEGRPRPIGAGAELVLHRVAQEGLTNVLKHGGTGATADVLLEWRDDAVRVVVTDSGVGPAPAAGREAGHGLLGLAERLAVYGGRLELGSRTGTGGARLVAELPCGGLIEEDRP